MDGTLIAVAGAGVVGGLVALGRGFVAYRMSLALVDTSPSRIASAAVGELLVTGVAEPAELTLVSPLQSAACLYYRSTIDEDGGERTDRATEERAVGFTVRDGSGAIRVFPRGARFDVPARFSGSTGTFGDEPAGLRLRTGAAYGALPDRDAQVAALLTVQPAAVHDGFATLAGGGSGFAALTAATRRARHYSEARIEPGDVVTVIGRALPFDQLDDPTSADSMIGPDPLLSDPEIAADLAAARAIGELEADPAEAWGNAAIPGFGIGRPVREPDLEAGVTRLALADRATADRFERTFAIAADDLVIAASDEVPLVISLGPPSVAAGRLTGAVLVGLLGAIVAIGSAMALALMLGGPS